jgi:hypothetical protein
MTTHPGVRDHDAPIPGAIRGGFTFIETLACLLVVVFGLSAVLGLVMWGEHLAGDAQARSTAMLTAVTAAVDQQPMQTPVTQSAWTYAPYNFDGSNTMSSTATGFLNGYWIVRSETTGDADVIARDPNTHIVYARTASVRVDVYDSMSGTVQASYSTRLVRQRNGQ